MPLDLTVEVGSLRLATPLVAASGTVGSVIDLAGVADLSRYGAAVAKSVSEQPWPGRPPPRLAATGAGMLNGIGIQNPGVERWAAAHADAWAMLPCPVWGSAVGTTPEEYARVAKGLGAAGVAAVEVNLSCPNLTDGEMFALRPDSAAQVIRAVRAASDVPVGAKLSPNAGDIVAVAAEVAAAGADFVTLTNTMWGLALDPASGRPLLSGGVGGLSGPPLKPVALRCVWEVHRALPELPIVGCGGVTAGQDVVDYLAAGASAVAVGTVHFARPRAAGAILRQLRRWCRRHRIERVRDLTGMAQRQ